MTQTAPKPRHIVAPRSRPARSAETSPCDQCAHAPKPAAPAGDVGSLFDRLEKTLIDLGNLQVELTRVLEQQHDAMKILDTAAMDRLGRRQEQLHRRAMQLECERRDVVAKLAVQAGLKGDITLRDLAEAYATTQPERRERLLELRDKLRKQSASAAKRGRSAARVAGSVLGSINSALRLLTRSCLYTRNGDFTLPPRRPRMETVG